MLTKQEKLAAVVAVMNKEGWPTEWQGGEPLLLSEGNLALAAFNAGYDLAAPTPSAALPVEGAGPTLSDVELAELVNKLDAVSAADKAWRAGGGSQQKWDAADASARVAAYKAAPGLLARLTAAEVEAATLRDTLAGYTHDAAPASVTAASVWVLQDRGNREVVGVYGSEAAARQAIEPDRDMKQYPDNPDYYHVEELPIESPASPASVTGTQEPAGNEWLHELTDRMAEREDEMEEAIALGSHHPDLEPSHRLLQQYVSDTSSLLAENARLRAAASIPVGGTPPNEWISVDERLPEFVGDQQNIEVNVFCNGKVSQAGYARNTYAKTEKGRIPRWEWHFRLWPFGQITHWQPLPAAPSDGK